MLHRVMTEAPRSFAEFWPYYVSQHLNATCRRFHFVGTGLGFLFVLASPFEPLLLLAAPTIGYAMSWIGHFGFEKNRPASWFSPLHFVWSFRGDVRMFRLMLLGRMQNEVDRARTSYAPA